MRIWTLQAAIIIAVAVAGLLVAQLPQAGKKPSPGARKVCAAIGYSANELDREACAELSVE
jgi:hypothetical protein